MYSALYVDDDVSFLEIGRMFLERTGFISVTTAVSAREALEKYHNLSFDVIITDYELPLMDGLRLLKEIRKLNSSIPFIIFTGRGREEVAIEALNSGASFYLQKGTDAPSQFAELINLIERAITHKKAEDELISANEQMTQALSELTTTRDKLQEQYQRIQESEIQLKQSEELFRSIFESADVGIFQCTPEGTYRLINQTFARMLGFDSPEEMKNSIFDIKNQLFIDPDDWFKVVDITSTSGIMRNLEIEFLRKDKTSFWGSINVVPNKNENEEITTYYGTCIDITHRKQAADELEKKNRELLSLNEDLASKEEELRQTISEMVKQAEQIRTSEERYRLVMEATSDGIWDWNLKTNMAFFSDHYYRMIGYEPGEFEGSYENWKLLVHPDDVKRAEAEVKNCFTSQTASFDTEFRIKTKQGQYRWIHGRGKVVEWDKNGNPLRMVGSHIDITDRKRMEEALLESEEKFRFLAEKTRDIIFLMRLPEGVYEYISPSILSLTGYSADEFYRSPELIKKLIPSSYQEYFQEKMNDLLHGIVPDEYEFQIITKDGQLKWINQRNTAILNDAREVVSLQGVVTDITERKTNEEIIREAMIKYEILFDSVPTGIIVTDESGGIIELNEYAASILKTPREEILEKGITSPEWIFYVSDGTPIFANNYSPDILLQMGKSITGMELGIRNPSGYQTWIMATSAPLGLEGFDSIISFLDISEQKRTGQALSMVNNKLSLLTSITRHDIKNSLTALKGYIFLLSEDVHSDSQKEFISKISTITADIQRKIDFTSTYQKIGAENPQWQKITPILSEIDTEDVIFTHDLDGVEIFADQMLGTVFENLILNSLMHGEKVTHISMYSIQKGQDLILVFEDDGVGISESEKEKIFERGYGKNTGFGLFLIREILSITGLNIRETGISEQGARFEILIPQGSFRFS